MTIFLKFIAYPGHKFLEKWLPSFLRDTGLKLIRGCTNGVANKFQGVLGRFEGKKIFRRLPVFFSFFAYPGSQIFWKMTNYFLERYRPEICCGLHKWCCERILRRFRSFRAKKNFSKAANFFFFFSYPGSQISWKMTNYFFERYRPEISRGLHKWCCERILRRFRLFWAKKIFFENLRFFYFFCISAVTDFLKNDQLLFWEITAWNFSWTAQMGNSLQKGYENEGFSYQPKEVMILHLCNRKPR